MARGTLLTVAVACAWISLGAVGCSLHHQALQQSAALRSPEGLKEWERQEMLLKERFLNTRAQYQREGTLDRLQAYEQAARELLDHGFVLYRAYRVVDLQPSTDMIPTLWERTGWLMDVADEYLKHGSLPIGVGLAADIVREYSDLPVMAPAQRRAQHVLAEYRTRQDYGP